MSDIPLSVEQHLSIGSYALSLIERLPPMAEDEAIVCFHFHCPDDAKLDRWADEAECVRRARPLFEAMPVELGVDYIGGGVGIEAWERARPDAAWMGDRIPTMMSVAEHAGMRFEGWSFEPRNGPVIHATTFSVMNANSHEGRMMLGNLLREVTELSNKQDER